MRWPRRALALALALAAAQLVQGHWLVWDYGLLDGSPIDWASTPARAWIDSALWLGCALAALVRPAAWCRRPALVLGGVVLLEVAGFAAVWPGAERSPARQPVVVEDLPEQLRDFARISRRGDALLVVIDTLPPDLFVEAIEDPELRAALPPGLTLYPDALAHHVVTDWSAQTLLTGVPLTPDIVRGNRRIEPTIDARVEASPVGRFARGGGSVGIATFRPKSLACGSLEPPLACLRTEAWREFAQLESRVRRDANDMLRVGLFRSSPQPLKASLHSGGRWQIAPLPQPLPPSEDPAIERDARDDLAVLASLRSNASASDRPAGVRMLHLFGSHQPPTLAADCTARTSEPRREATIDTARCLLSRVFGWLARLDELGLYDPATLVIVSDHGHPSVEFDPAILGEPPVAPAAKDLDYRGKLDHAVPVVLAKPPGARHALRTNSNPVALCDVAATLAEALEQPHELECPSLFASSATRGPRYHLRTGKLTSRRGSRPIEFEVGTPAWAPEAWRIR